MQETGRDDEEARFFCYCDFDNFKPFNDHYGFQMGDHAISLFAALMKRYFFSDGDFLGHVGGDDFFIGVRDWTRDELNEILERLLSDFHDDVVELYSPEERAAGKIRGHDRAGAERDFPLLRCSIGVLELPQGLLLDDVGRIGSEIAAVKAEAKEKEDGLVFASFGETK
jgi:GGDEF domain-containing protein